MKKSIIRILSILVIISISFIPKMCAKDLTFQADANINQIRYTTFVKAFNDSPSSNHSNPIQLKDRVGGNGYYQTRYINFHIGEGSKYSDRIESNNDKIWFFDVPKSPGTVINATNYQNYDNLINDNGGRTVLLYNGHNDPINASTYTELFSTYSETSDFAVEESSYYGNDTLMRRSTFRLGTSSTQKLKNVITSNVESNKLETITIGDTVYAKVRVSNVLSHSGNYSVVNAWRFNYDGNPGWASENYGMNASGAYIKGKSALNNFDNWLLIPYKQKQENREIYVTYRILGTTDEDSVFFRYPQERQKLVTGAMIDNLGYIEYDNEYWLEHYSLTEAQRGDGKGLTVTQNKEIVESNLHYGNVKYKYAGYKVTAGTYDSGIQKAESVDVANGNENEGDYKTPIKVTFYYEPDGGNNKYQKVYIKHVDKNNNTSLSELAGTETFSPGFKENDLIKLNDTKGYQSSYIFKADGITNGGVYKSNKLSSSNTVIIGGKRYTYAGVKGYTSEDYSDANSKVASSQLKNNDGFWMNPQRTQKVTTIIFYYTSGGGTGENPPGNETETIYNDLHVSGLLDYINKGDFKYSTYDQKEGSNKNGNNDFDYIPTGETLSPYLYNVEPFFIKALRFEKTEDTKKITKSINWSVYHLERQTTDHGTYSEVSYKRVTDKSGTINFNVTFNYEYNTITDFLYYRIKNLNVYDTDGDTNQGGLLYGDTNQTINVATTNAYKNRTNFSVGSVTPEVSKFFTKNYYGGRNEVKTTKIEIEGSQSTVVTADTILNKIGKMYVSFKCGNDYINVNGSDSKILKQNSDEHIVEITGANTTVNIDCTDNYYNESDLKNFMKGQQNKTTYDDFEYKNNLKVKNGEFSNGIRQLSGSVEYELKNVKGSSKVKQDNALVTLKNGDSNIVDSLNKDLNVNKLDDDFTANFSNSAKEDGNGYFNLSTNVRRVNVYNPLNISAKIDGNSNIINFSNKDSNIIQTGQPFTLVITPKNDTGIYGGIDTKNYIKGFYVTMDFAISNVQCQGNSGNLQYYNNGSWTNVVNDTSVERNTDIYIPYNGSGEIKLTANPEGVIGAAGITGISNNISVVAIANNVTSKLDEAFKTKNFKNSWVLYYNNYLDYFENKVLNETIIDNNSNSSSLTTLDSFQKKQGFLSNGMLFYSANHAVHTNVDTNNAGRIFNFRITDCTDLAFKNIFRKSSSNENEHSTNAYYSGKKFYDYNNIATYIGSGDNSIMGTDEDRKLLLPLGPYKSTDTTYVKAPKLGYRISYEVSTSGYDSDQKQVEIVPRYYYISKDATEFIRDIDLYYKNSSGKYVKLDNYNIYYQPNNSYRLKTNGIKNAERIDTARLTSDLVKLNVNKMILNNTMYGTSNGGYIQTWYGEFKLPNSTIAVKQGESIKNQLTDGYIGVIFDMKYSEGGTEVYYGAHGDVGKNNTTEWDYEGYLGSIAGQTNRKVIQLERGTWDITNDRYQQIKGTVLLYDIDNRAANDFN